MLGSHQNETHLYASTANDPQDTSQLYTLIYRVSLEETTYIGSDKGECYTEHFTVHVLLRVNLSISASVTDLS